MRDDRDQDEEPPRRRPSILLVAALFALALGFYLGAFFLLGD